MLSKILTKPFLVTLFRYALAATGAWLVANGMLDEGTWETIGGALLTIAVALMGASESVKDKIVQDGKTVETAKLSPSVQSELQVAVNHKPGRTVLDMLLGK